jgi:general secretion pathway protein M
MNARIPSGITHWWKALAVRERRMVAVMLMAVASFAVWYGVVAPVAAWRDAAAARRAQAAGSLARVQADLALVARLRDALPAPGALEATLRDSAEASGVALSSLRRAPGGDWVATADRVEAPVLFAWLDQLREAHGLGPRRLRIVSTEGRVEAEVAFPSAP